MSVGVTRRHHKALETTENGAEPALCVVRKH